MPVYKVSVQLFWIVINLCPCPLNIILLVVCSLVSSLRYPVIIAEGNIRPLGEVKGVSRGGGGLGG